MSKAMSVPKIITLAFPTTLSDATFYMYVYMLLVLPLDTATCSGIHIFEGTNWTVSWAVNGSNITFTMFGPADGWIGIGLSSFLNSPATPVSFTAFLAMLQPPWWFGERYLSSCNTNTT